MNFEAIIGLELHVQMKTKSKLFSSAPVIFGNIPNTDVALFDMAFPGTLPQLNKQAVIYAIRVAHALNMTIDNELWFDRKNYFYSDLAKGYQITQQARPLGKDGWLEVKNGKHINIERLHIEEDTCKQLHKGNSTFLDYNRSGVPLVEIVSKPEISSGKEAMEYVEKIRSIVSFLDVSDGKMEEGSLRCDVNISMRPIGGKRFGTKVEIKNLNSLANIQKAIDYETKRQESILLSGGVIKQETRRFDETKKQTVLMRIKTDEIDYKCFTEPNILPIQLSEEFINSAINSSPELAETRYLRYLSIGLNEYDSSLLVAHKDISNYFDDVIKEGANPKLAANWINVDVQTILNKKNISIKEFNISPQNLAKLIIAIEQKKLSNKQAREMFDIMINSGHDFNSIMKSMNASLISDEDTLLKLVKQVIKDNPQSIEEYRNGKDRIVGYLVGIIMKQTEGKANPALTNKLIVEQLKGE